MLEWPHVLARFGQSVSTLLVFGTSAFYLYDARSVSIGTGVPPHGGSGRLLKTACVVALASSLAGLMAEAASVTGDPSNAWSGSTVWAVVSTTHFGEITALRILLLSICTLAAFVQPAGRPLWFLETALGAGVVTSYAWTGHGALDEGVAGVVHLGGDVLHLLTAGIWIGALAALGTAIHRCLAAQTLTDARRAVESLERFSAVGAAVIGLLVLGGLMNAWYLIGPNRWSALLTSAYGRALVVKIALFAPMLVLACANRFWLTPKLRTRVEQASSLDGALRRLRLTVTSETVLALLVLAAVAVLGTLEPPVSTSP